MSRLSKKTKKCLYKFYFGEISASTFEKWLYNEHGCEEELGNDRYIDLISLDYNNADDVEKAIKFISVIYTADDADSLYLDRARNVLTGMLGGQISLAYGCKMLSSLRDNGYSIIPAIFVGYSSEIERLGDNGFYDDKIIADAQKLLEKLNRGE